MSDNDFSCPMSREQVINTYFLEHRARVLDVAAFLDRIDRSRAASSVPDFRELALQQTLQILADGKPHRARRILELLSDAGTDIPESAHGMKGASGAVRSAAGGKS